MGRESDSLTWVGTFRFYENILKVNSVVFTSANRGNSIHLTSCQCGMYLADTYLFMKTLGLFEKSLGTAALKKLFWITVRIALFTFCFNAKHVYFKSLKKGGHFFVAKCSCGNGRGKVCLDLCSVVH